MWIRAAELIGSRALWWACGLAGALAHLILWDISEPDELFSDFYKAYFPAAELLLDEGPEAPWAFEGAEKIGFINFPIVAYLFAPLAALDWDAGWAYLGLGAAATIAAFMLLRRLGGLEAAGGALLLFLFLVNGPLANSLREGNTTHFILLLLIVALLLWRNGWEFAAGLVLGACAILKLPFLLFGIFFLLRGRWRIVAGGATTVAATALLSLAVFGAGVHGEWIKCCVEPFMGKALPAFNVQSIDGLLMRFATGVAELEVWEPHDPSLLHKAARLSIVAALLGGALWLMWRADRSRPARDARAKGPLHELEFVLVLVLALVISPVSWSHYYLLLLLPWALYLGGRLPLPEDALTRRLMWSGFLLASLPVVLVPLESDWLGAVAARTAVSAWLIGGLLILAALMRGAWHAATPRGRGAGMAEARI